MAAGGGRPAPLLPGGYRRRGARDPREDRQRSDGARPGPGPHRGRAARAGRHRAGGSHVAAARSAAAPPAHPGGGPQPAARRVAAAAGGADRGGSPAHRRGDAGVPRHPGGPTVRDAAPAAGRLSPRVPARVGQPPGLRPDPHRSAPPGHRARPPRRHARPGSGARAAQGPADRAHRWQPALPRGERARAGGDPGAHR